jgi:large subunit ribosomal protein L35
MAKYKVKTRKAAAKRFTVKPSGKVKRSKAGKRHLLTAKSRKRKNKLKKAAYVHPSNMSLVLPCLPNG